jgi:hypothetical protein
MKLINLQANFPIRDANVKTIRLKKEALEERAHQILMGNVELNSLPFDDIFGKKYRVSFPLMNETLSNIIDLLKKGETKTGKKYDVDLSTQMATYKVKNRDGDLVKKQVKAGKVIGRELGPNYLDHWAKGLTGQGKHIIVSRHPIDIARMSDHDRWSSCHAPPHKNRTGYDAWKSALNEAEDGGLVAYVIDTKDLGGINLQEEEIFEDQERGVDGIEPKSRVRLNRYHSEDFDLAIPVTKIYGDNNDGFLESVKDWAYGAQKDKFQNENEDLALPMGSFERKGGSYADIPNDSELFNYFFDTNQFSGAVKFTGKGGKSQIDIWHDEVESITLKYGSQLKYFSVYPTVEYQEGNVYMYISASVFFTLPSSGNLSNVELEEVIHEYFDSDGFETHSKGTYWLFEYESTSLKEGEFVVKFFLSGEDFDVSTPDEYREKVEELIEFEKEKYLNLKYKIYRDLEQINVAKNVTQNKDRLINNTKFKNFSIYDAEADDLDDETDLVDLFVNIDLHPMPWEFERDDEFDEIYNAIMSDIGMVAERSDIQTTLFDDKVTKPFSPKILFRCRSDKTTLKIYYKLSILESSEAEFKYLFSYMKVLDDRFEILKNMCVKTFYDKSIYVLYSGDLWINKIEESPWNISLIPEEVYNDAEFRSSLAENLHGVFGTRRVGYFSINFDRYFNRETMKYPEYVEAFVDWVKYARTPQGSNNDSKQKDLSILLHNVVKDFPETYRYLSDLGCSDGVCGRIDEFLRYKMRLNAAKLLPQIVSIEKFNEYYALVRDAYITNLDYDACRASNFPREFTEDDFVKREMIEFLLQSGLSYKDISTDNNLAYCINQVARDKMYFEEREQRKEQENIEANSNWYKLHKESVK